MLKLSGRWQTTGLLGLFEPQGGEGGRGKGGKGGEGEVEGGGWLNRARGRTVAPEFSCATRGQRGLTEAFRGAGPGIIMMGSSQ